MAKCYFIITDAVSSDVWQPLVGASLKHKWLFWKKKQGREQGRRRLHQASLPEPYLFLTALTALSFGHHLGWLLLFRAGWVRDLIRPDLESQGSQLRFGTWTKIHISTWFLWPPSILYGCYVGSDRTIKQRSVTEQMSLVFFHLLFICSHSLALTLIWQQCGSEFIQSFLLLCQPCAIGFKETAHQKCTQFSLYTKCDCSSKTFSFWRLFLLFCTRSNMQWKSHPKSFL